MRSDTLTRLRTDCNRTFTVLIFESRVPLFSYHYYWRCGRSFWDKEPTERLNVRLKGWQVVDFRVIDIKTWQPLIKFYKRRMYLCPESENIRMLNVENSKFMYWLTSSPLLHLKCCKTFDETRIFLPTFRVRNKLEF